jgi:hypothetical protein
MAGICANAVVNLLGISVRAIRNIDEIIADMDISNERDKNRLAIILSLVVSDCRELSYYTKLVKIVTNLDEDFTIEVLFPYIILSLKQYVQEIFVDYMEVASEKYNENKYLGVCDMSKKIIEDFKKIETYFRVYGNKRILEKVRPAVLCDKK